MSGNQSSSDGMKLTKALQKITKPNTSLMHYFLKLTQARNRYDVPEYQSHLTPVMTAAD